MGDFISLNFSRAALGPSWLIENMFKGAKVILLYIMGRTVTLCSGDGLQ